jgi:hypothetical protein
MDFLESMMKKIGFVREKKAEKEIVEKSVKPKIDLGVCVPIHAVKKGKDVKKIKFSIPQNEESPFDKIRKAYEKDKSDFSKEVRDITEQEPAEPFDYAPELGVESIERKKPISFENAYPKSTDEESTDELDIAGKKMTDGYVPRFSATARQKLGMEEKPIAPVSNSYAQFEITGIYSGGAETMISGIVRCGKLTKRMSAQVGKNSLRISDIKKSFVSVGEINEGESGTIFTRGSAGIIRNGDVIEFA